jgi:hypothetical protein
MTSQLIAIIVVSSMGLAAVAQKYDRLDSLSTAAYEF